MRACLLIFIGKTSIRYEPDCVEVMKFIKIGGSTQQAGSQFCLISFTSRRANSITIIDDDFLGSFLRRLASAKVKSIDL
ncbi:hypothetical protein BW154_01770 [Lactococcus lactis]|uniref:Uncharacterized protein n=1 Tax=Lactococcus lactis TaxID=1358 RepID=A0AAP8E415_9LACT|nr:hypothetical protein BW154_01770 [Lactococcus lactis]